MFEGSEHYPGDFFKPLQRLGAGINGSTSTDRTNYFVDTPAAHVELALAMESDRMGYLPRPWMRPSCGFRKTSSRTSTGKTRQPALRHGLAAHRRGLYPPGHPYSWLTIGVMEDVEAATRDDVEAFFRRYYVPSNASLCLVGDIAVTAAPSTRVEDRGTGQRAGGRRGQRPGQRGGEAVEHHLGLRVTEPGVELHDPQPGRGQAQAGVEQAPVRRAAAAEFVHGRLEHGVPHLLGQAGRGPGQRGIGTHPAGVRPEIPVLGPLEVLRSQQRDGGGPVRQREQRHLRSVQVLLDDHGAARGRVLLRGGQVVVTTTPLPAARPSALTTYGGPNSASAASASAALVQVRAWAVGIPAASMIRFAYDLDPSITAARRLGPKQEIPEARSASATPATSGASGPITTRSAPTARASPATWPGSVTSAGCRSASAAMPGLPGAACRPVTSGSAASARASACSRPPDPRRRTRTR